MEAKMTKAKVAYDIKTEEKITLLEAGERVPVVPWPQTNHWRVAPGHPLAGFTIADHECEVVLTIEEVAVRVDRAPGTILRWLADGVIAGEKVPGKGKGGQWRVPLTELDGLQYPKPGPKGGQDD